MTQSPATSRRMIQRSLWGGMPSEAETRAYLQERLTFLFKLMFWSLVALMAFLGGMYTVYPDDAPEQRNWVYLAAGIGLAGMAFAWRVQLVRKPLSVTTLHGLDLAYSLCIGTAFGISAYLQNDLRASGYLSVVYSTFTVFARALILPSTPLRTLVASILTFLPMTIAALALALQREQDMPGPMYFVGYLLFSVAPILLATLGSQIIYGLRQKATEAQQLGQYTLDRKIGEGGNGSVYLAHHMLLRRPTAVKLLLPDRVGPDNLQRFEREVQTMSRLTHPNTVAIYDFGHSPDGTFYYAMEYLGGGIDLEKLVRHHGPQPTGRVVQILTQVCGALIEAHGHQMIHRDIKPANILLCERGGVPDVAKVVDYGLVKEVTAETGQTQQVVLGTPGYLAPEAITSPATIGPPVDLYAVGAVGYFLLTGKRVFDGNTALDICIQHVTKPVTPPSQVTDRPIQPELEAIVLRCLAKAPEDRHASARELRDALRALPRDPAWDDAAARAWWRSFRDTEQQVMAATDADTRTIQVELGERA